MAAKTKIQKTWESIVSKITAKRVESAAQSTITAYLETIGEVFKPVPPMLGEIAGVLVTHKTEIENAIITIKVVMDECKPILDKFTKDINSDNEEINKIWEDLTIKFDKLFK